VSETQSRREFVELVSRPDPEVDLGRAALLIACEEYPDLDLEKYLHRLDGMGEALRNRMRGAAAFPIAELNRYLFEEEGFHGNRREYYDPRNSFLNDVLDRMTGIPITLSTVYMEVGRRAGLALEGVALPGHFIVRFTGTEEGWLIDPFHGGALLTPRDCQRRLDRVYQGRVKLEAGMLAAVTRKHILERMLRNLKAIYMKSDDAPRALKIVELLLRIDPRSGEDLRDRGLLHAAMDCFQLATSDLEAYLSMVPQAENAEALWVKVAEMRHKSSRLN